jgi:hypothetical protein
VTVCADAAESPPSMNAPKAEPSKAARPRRRSSDVVMAEFSASIIPFPWFMVSKLANGRFSCNRLRVKQPTCGPAGAYPAPVREFSESEEQ